MHCGNNLVLWEYNRSKAWSSSQTVQSGKTHSFLSEHEDLSPCVQKRRRKSLAVRLHCDEITGGDEAMCRIGNPGGV